MTPLSKKLVEMAPASDNDSDYRPSRPRGPSRSRTKYEAQADQLMAALEAAGIPSQRDGVSSDKQCPVIAIPGFGSVYLDDVYVWGTADQCASYDGSLEEFSLDEPQEIVDWVKAGCGGSSASV